MNKVEADELERAAAALMECATKTSGGEPPDAAFGLACTALARVGQLDGLTAGAVFMSLLHGWTNETVVLALGDPGEAHTVMIFPPGAGRDVARETLN